MFMSLAIFTAFQSEAEFPGWICLLTFDDFALWKCIFIALLSDFILRTLAFEAERLLLLSSQSANQRNYVSIHLNLCVSNWVKKSDPQLTRLLLKVIG